MLSVKHGLAIVKKTSGLFNFAKIETPKNASTQVELCLSNEFDLRRHQVPSKADILSSTKSSWSNFDKFKANLITVK